ncbi:MAG: hypothetical protein KKI08_22405 [Armatimonadetes bacterium]|nr:hypothetical protein [Armatimonadota bacterium]
MTIYTWFYPDMAQLADPGYGADIVARLQRLQATGLFCIPEEGAALADPAPLREFMARCQGAGLDCQIGFLPFSEPPDPTPEMLRRRYTYSQDGALKYRGLCPAWPENRMLAVHRATQLLEALEPGALHLDFMRYFFANNPVFGVDLEWEDGRKWLDTYFRCDCPLCQTERLELLGREATAYDQQHPGFVFKRIQQRAEHVEEVLRALRRLTQQHDTRLTAAVRVQYFNRALIEGQDWVRWCEEGLVDAISPMNYATSVAVVERRFLENQRLLRNARVAVWEGIARRSSAGENTAEELLAQARRLVELGADGVALFQLGVLTDEDYRLWETL